MVGPGAGVVGALLRPVNSETGAGRPVAWHAGKGKRLFTRYAFAWGFQQLSEKPTLGPVEWR